ncbi:carbonic anhydrase family protein [uncultured Pseudokineococcus sp.]|uniref:carbonic anhydrase family protein n=1 Tax=uncultured Pseudokineococcus sp. TaxID=1642928 RepID=UPI00260B4029|nr:carbonic anhydrase family protein [uncultured Pseudokineococcus sp.]
MDPSRRSVLSVPLVLAAGAATAAPAVAADPPQQSPVDLRRTDVSRRRALPPLEVHYDRDAVVSLAYISQDAGEPGGCATRGVEETQQAGVQPGAGHVVVDGTRYDLLQTHFHTPSEHTVDGRHTPLEQHLVHASEDGRLLVVAVLLVEGEQGEADRLLAVLPDECADPVPVEHVDLRAMMPRRIAAVRYAGSLTTAPYTEGVQWFVVGSQTVSAAGIASFRALFPDGDAREVQPLSGRRILADPAATAWLRRL